MTNNYEYVYCLTNPAMPDWVKVGKAKNIKNRLTSLNKKTAVPLPFECPAALRVPANSVFKVEHGLHEFLGFSFQKEKEFFRTSLDNVIRFFNTMRSVLPDCQLIMGDELNHETLQEKKKAAATNFALLDIPIGSQLVYINDISVVCTVADESNKVLYKNKSYSISALAVELRGYNVNGYKQFMFEDETLWKRRQRLHPEL